MDKLMLQLGQAKGLLENADDFEKLKAALNATLNTIELLAEELRALREDHEELDVYVDSLDDDLVSLEDRVDLYLDDDDDYDLFDDDDDDLFDDDDDEEYSDEVSDEESEGVNKLWKELFESAAQNSEDEDESLESGSQLSIWEKSDDEDDEE